MPWEFDRLTIAELNGMVEAKAKREREWWERTQELVAWAVVHLMNATGNFEQPVTMDQLLGRSTDMDNLKARLEKVKAERAKKK